MKINIFAKGKLAFNPYTEKNVGVGSTETTLIHVAEELQKRGHDVTCYVNCNFADIYDDVRYFRAYDYRPDEDVLIGFGTLPKNIKAPRVFLWETKVEPDGLKTIDEAWRIKNLIMSSEWHRDRYASEIPSTLVSKMTVIEPGVTKDFLDMNVQERWPLSVAFAGAPQKGGMTALIEYAKRIKPKNKDVALHAYGGGHLWGWDDQQFRPLYDEMIRNKIYYHGQKGKRKMVKHFGYSQIMFNPVRKGYQQAFGLTVLEAMAAGCVVIANNNGNVRNLVKDAGYVINENCEDYKFAIEASDLTLKLFSDPQLIAELSAKAKKYASEYTWQKTVDKFEALI